MATKKGVHVRLDAKEKKHLEELFGRIGLDLPTAIRLFFRRVELTGGIPFPLNIGQTANEYTPEQIAKWDKISKDAEQGKNIAREFQLPEERAAMSEWLLHG